MCIRDRLTGRLTGWLTKPEFAEAIGIPAGGGLTQRFRSGMRSLFTLRMTTQSVFFLGLGCGLANPSKLDGEYNESTDGDCRCGDCCGMGHRVGPVEYGGTRRTSAAGKFGVPVPHKSFDGAELPAQPFEGGQSPAADGEKLTPPEPPLREPLGTHNGVERFEMGVVVPDEKLLLGVEPGDECER